MRLGIFAKTFARSSVEETFDAVRAHGLDATQFNLSVARLASLPDRIPAALADRVRTAARARELDIPAVSGTFNMAHPDPQARASGLRRLDVLAGACCRLGTGVITLCTGTRDPEDMWRRHADNTTAEAWQDMRATVVDAIAIAERHDVVLAIEPEIGNVVRSPAAARRLLDELRSPRLRVVIDPANLFDAGDPSRQLANSEAVLTEAFELLAGDIVLAHAKDVTEHGSFAAAGQGDVDWARYVALLAGSGYTGALVMHGLDEADVAGSTAFLGRLLEAGA
jgi:sugar phosphate isomerase/epimerase